MPYRHGCVDPTRLPGFVRRGSREIYAVIETPKGSRNKFAWSPEVGAFQLKKVLPSGMEFPYDFGFVPSTRAADGDPLDLLIFMDEPAFAGCILEARLIGVIEAEQTEEGKTERNDRLIAVASKSHENSNMKSLADLNPTLLKDLQEFFKNYHANDKIRFKVIGHGGPAAALALVKKAAARKK